MNIFESAFFCKLNKNHLLNNAKRLPCGASACINCIKKEHFEDRVMKCKACNNSHFITNPNYLPSGVTIENFLTNLILGIKNEVKCQLKKSSFTLEKAKWNLESCLDYFCNCIQDEIVKKFDPLNIELGKMLNEKHIKMGEDNEENENMKPMIHSLRNSNFKAKSDKSEIDFFDVDKENQAIVNSVLCPVLLEDDDKEEPKFQVSEEDNNKKTTEFSVFIEDDYKQEPECQVFERDNNKLKSELLILIKDDDKQRAEISIEKHQSYIGKSNNYFKHERNTYTSPRFMMDKQLIPTKGPLHQMKGVVKWFSYTKRYGFIKSNDQDVFVHLEDTELSHPLKRGDFVTFYIVRCDKGFKATKIQHI